MRTGAFCGRGGQIPRRTYLRWPQLVSPYFLNHWRSRSTLGFLRRNLRKCPAQLKERAYIAFVRSTLDYASPIWDPFLKRDINNLEKMNRRAARFVTGDYHPISSVSSMLHSLGWSDLKDRRRDTRLALLFKMVNGDVAVAADDLQLEPADRRTRSNHRHKYKHKGASTPELQNFFHYRTISEWNSLPASIAEAESVIYTPQRRSADYWTYTYTTSTTYWPSHSTCSGSILRPGIHLIYTIKSSNSRLILNDKNQDVIKRQFCIKSNKIYLI